jgi:hypothetical protein
MPHTTTSSTSKIPSRTIGSVVGSFVTSRSYRSQIQRCHIAVPSCLDCTDKDRLLAEYNRDVQEWSKAVQHLSDQVGMGHDEYLLLLDRLNEVRTRTQRARDAYEKHIADHGC